MHALQVRTQRESGVVRGTDAVVRRLLHPEYALVAKQWTSGRTREGEEHIFAYLDFQNGPEIFQRVRRCDPFRPHPTTRCPAQSAAGGPAPGRNMN